MGKILTLLLVIIFTVVPVSASDYKCDVIREQTVTAGNQFDGTAGTGLFDFNQRKSGQIARLILSRSGITESITVTWKINGRSSTTFLADIATTTLTSDSHVVEGPFPVGVSEVVTLVTTGATEHMYANACFVYGK